MTLKQMPVKLTFKPRKRMPPAMRSRYVTDFHQVKTQEMYATSSAKQVRDNAEAIDDERNQ